MKKPSEVELVAMALWWTNNYPRAETSDWKKAQKTLKSIFRQDARAFLRALRGGR